MSKRTKSASPLLNTKTAALFLFVLLAFFKTNAQTSATATWSLTSSANTTPSTSGAIAAYQQTKGPGVTVAPTYPTTIKEYPANTAQPCQAVQVNPALTNTTSVTAHTNGVYVEYKVAPLSGNSFNISSVFVNIGSGGGTALGVSIEYSTDPTFASSTVLGATGGAITFPRKDTLFPFTFNPSALTLNNGEALYLRIYGWYGSTSARFMYLHNLKITGTTTGVAVPAPTTQASNVTFSNIFANNATVSLTRGDGAYVAVFMKEGTGASSDNPVDGTTYTASTNWSSKGSQLASSGYYCIYNGNAATGSISIPVSNLSPSTTYTVQAFEFNGSGSVSAYNTSTSTGNPNSFATTLLSIYRSATSGDWSDPATWQVSTDYGVTYGPASSAPASTDGTVTIQNGHKVTVTTPVIADELTVSTGSTLEIAAGVTFTAADGNGTDLTLNGTMKTIGTFTQSSGSTMTAGSNAIYEDANPSVATSTATYQKIPTASWAAGSKVKVTGIVGTVNGTSVPQDYPLQGMNQSFSRFEIDAPDLIGKLILGATGAKVFSVTDSLIVRSTGTSTFGLQITSSSNQDTVIVNNYRQYSGIVSIIHNSGNTIRKALFVNGSFTLDNDALFNIAAYNTTATTSTIAAELKVTGDISVAGTATLRKSTQFNTNGTATLVFNGTTQAANLGVNFNATAANFGPVNVTVGTTSPVTTPTVNMSSDLVIPTGATLNVNTGSKLIMAPKTVMNVAGTGNFNDQSVTFKSNSTGTASLAEVTGSLTGATSVTVERYITSSSNRAYRLLAPSVNTTSSIKVNWQEGTNNPDVSTNNNPNPGYGTHITGTGGAANGFDETATNTTSLYTYDQATPAWVAVGNTNGTLDAKTGYLLYVRGDRSVDLSSASLPSTNTTLRATGALVVGPVSYTSLASDGGFSLVANPYAAPLDWSLAYTGTNATNFENYYTYWDPNLGTRGAYVTVMTDNTTSVLGGASGTPAATKDIQSGQAFFLKTKAGISSPTFSVDEAYKGSNNNNNVFRTGSTEKFGVNLYFNAGASLKLADGAVAVYSQNGNTAVDGNDAEEIASWDENIAIAREGKHLSIETRPLIDGNDNLPLFINHLKAQQYTLELVPVSFSATNISATLVDKYLQTRTPVSLSATTTVPFDVTNDAASSAPDRFTVEFSASSTLPVTLSNVKAYQKAQGIQVEWTAQSEVNMTGYEVEKSSDGRQFSKATSVAANGSAVYNWLDAAATSGTYYYRIKAISRSGQIQYSQVVRVNLSKAGADISIYPNPVKGKVLSLQLNDVAKGKYSVAIFNSLGQQVFNKVIEHQGGSATQTIQLDNTITKGIYQLRISGDGVSKTQQLIKE